METFLTVILFIFVGFWLLGQIGRWTLRWWIARKQKEFQQQFGGDGKATGGTFGNGAFRGFYTQFGNNGGNNAGGNLPTNGVTPKTTKLYLVDAGNGKRKVETTDQLTELYTSGTELFTGTKAEFRWPQSARAAVVNLKFGTVPANQNFEANLCVRLATAFIMAGLVESTAALEQENLVTLMAQLELLTQGQDLVVLIDEWDKPLSAGTDRAIEARLNSFYAWLSSLENIKFLLITGIMHYRETEVFLGPDLRDLGQEPCAPALLGLTLDEVSEIYSDYLDQATQRLNTSREVLLAQIKQHYGQNGTYSPWVMNYR